MLPHDYDSLRNEYPANITANIMYKICRISKRSAAYLLQHGIVPCSDNGRKTHRYTVKLDDVIEYLKKRETEGSMIPTGMMTVKKKHTRNQKQCFSDLVASDDENALLGYFTSLTQGFPDVLSTDDCAAITGLRRNTILKYLNKGIIESITSVPHYLIPKAYLLSYVTSDHYLNTRSDTESFKKILGGFESWSNAK